MLDTTIHSAPDHAALEDSFAPPIIEVKTLSVWYGVARALDRVSFGLLPREVLAFIGPSGCGKTTALKCLNRMHDGQRGLRLEGQILMHGRDIMDHHIDPPAHRRRFGWVAQKPNPFPWSIYENVAYGARLHGLARDKADMEHHVEACLRRADLWAEVKDDLHRKTGLDLSGGQQQRLCIARALSTRPEVVLMDEPTASLDPIATGHIEDLMREIATDLSVLVITHSMMQARRVADRVAHFHLGRLLDIGPTERVFTTPVHRQTRDFVTGLVG